MIEFNEELVEKVDFDELDIGFISMYQKEEDGTLKLKGHSTFFKIDGKIVFNNKFKILPECLKTTKIYFGKKGLGTVFNELFTTFLKVPGTVKYCYEMKKFEIESEKAYLNGEY